MAEQLYLTTEEVAALLHVSAETIRDRALAGSLPCFKDGKRWLFPRADLLAALEARTQGHQAKAQRAAPVQMPPVRQPIRVNAGAPRIVLFPDAPWRTEEELRALNAASPAAGSGRTARTKKSVSQR